MSTTVTTTTVTSVSLLDMGAVITLVVVLLLIGALITKEIMSSVQEERAQAVNKVLSVAAIPLAMAFGFVIVTKLVPVF